MTNLNTVTQSTLVNPTVFEQELNKLAIAIKGNEFSLYTIVSHELNTSDETIVKEIFTRIMCTDNGFNPSTVARYFTDIKKLGVIASNYVTLASYKKALKDLGIMNMNSANVWLSRESAITIAIRGVNLDNRNSLLSKRVDIKNVNDVRLLLTAIGEQATIDQKANEAAKVEAAKVEAAKVEAAKVEAAKVEAAKVEAAKVEAAKVEEAKVEEAKVEEAKVEEAKVEEAKVEEAIVKNIQGNKKGNKKQVCTEDMFDAVLATMRIMSDLQLKNLQASLLAMVEQKKTGTK